MSEVDMSRTITPKSDQMNSDDLISGPMTIKITKVSADTSSAEQPILVNYEGDNGKPYKPCKSMRRVMVAVWGSDGSQYAGRSMTLYRDPTVKWGGLEVGGIRISHMTNMDAPMTMALTATKQSRKPYTVKPLVVADQVELTPIDIYAKEFGAKIKGSPDDLTTWWTETADRRTELKIPAERLGKMTAAYEKATNKENDA